jgi:hypothetical protein
MHAEFQENFWIVPIQGHDLLPRRGLFLHRVKSLAQPQCPVDRALSARLAYLSFVKICIGCL